MVSRSEVPGPRVLLSNYLARVISRGSGILPVLVSLVLQHLIGAPWSFYGHTKCVFLVLQALFILAPALAGHISVFHAVSYRGSHSRGWSEVFFCFRPGLRGEDSRPLLPCSSVCGLHCTGPTKCETIAMGDCYILCSWSGVSWTTLLRIVSDASGSFLPQGVARRSYRRPLSPSGSGCRCHGYAGFRLRNGLFVFLELGALVLSLHLFFEKNFAVILVRGRVCGTRTYPCGAAT